VGESESESEEGKWRNLPWSLNLKRRVRKRRNEREMREYTTVGHCVEDFEGF